MAYLVPASAPAHSSRNDGQLELTLHDDECVLHAHVPFSALHFNAARAAASHECFGTLQKKKRSHAALPQASAAPLLHHASHSADVATFGVGLIAVTPPWSAQTFVHSVSPDESDAHVPWAHTDGPEMASPSVHTH
jgi:hypothetical protein